MNHAYITKFRNLAKFYLIFQLHHINKRTNKFTIRRERKGIVDIEEDIILSFKEFEQKFRDFRKFQNLFFKLMENYLFEHNK